MATGTTKGGRHPAVQKRQEGFGRVTTKGGRWALSAIDRIIEDRHLLRHPFYERWQKGKVSQDVLREYAKQYYAYECRLPAFLTAALSHLGDGPAKQAVTINLADESGMPESHPELWLRFCEALGLSRDEVMLAELTPRTINLIETYACLCTRGPDEALSALYAYEAQFSAISRTKGESLRMHYEITNRDALKFFEVHATLDDEHAAALRSGLIDSELARESVLLAVEAWWGMLDQFQVLALAGA
jgi:pyrroloquinoline-quinone synthase